MRIFCPDVYGTEAMARAVQGSAPIAYKSDSVRGGDLTEEIGIVDECAEVIHRLD